MTFVSKRFDIEPEITSKILKKGYQIYEVPISYFWKEIFRRKNWRGKMALVALWTLIKYRFVN